MRHHAEHQRCVNTPAQALQLFQACPAQQAPPECPWAPAVSPASPVTRKCNTPQHHCSAQPFGNTMHMLDALHSDQLSCRLCICETSCCKRGLYEQKDAHGSPAETAAAAAPPAPPSPLHRHQGRPTKPAVRRQFVGVRKDWL
jgi:hypothetical protein